MTEAAAIFRAWQDAQRETGGNSVTAFSQLLRQHPSKRAALFAIAAKERVQG